GYSSPETFKFLVTEVRGGQIFKGHLKKSGIKVKLKPWSKDDFIMTTEGILEESKLISEDSYKPKKWHLSVSNEKKQKISRSVESDEFIGHGELVLVIDDNADMRKMIIKKLKSLRYKVESAVNGREGFEVAIEKMPALIIVDWIMDEMDGPTFIEKVKKNNELSSIPIVLLTAKSDAESRVMGTALGADCFLGKPFNENELAGLVRNMIKLRVNEKKVIDEKKKLGDILDNLAQGFMIIDKSGVVQEGASRGAKEIFGKEIEKKNLSSILNLESSEEELFSKWLKNIWRGSLSFNDLLPLGPKVFKTDDGRYIKLGYRPVYEENSKNNIDKVICLATDKTEEIKLERQLEHDKQRVNFITNCLQNPVEFVDLMDDSYEILEVYSEMKELDLGGLFRHFHTLKARYGQFGVRELTNYIDKIEISIEKGQLEEMDKKVYDFRLKLQDFLKKNSLIVEAANKFMVDNGQAIHISDLMDRIDKTNDIKELKFDLYKNFLLSDIQEKFKRYGSLVEELAERQGKRIETLFSGEKILVNYSKYSDFVNISVHLFRNMVDHGIETEDERVEKAKPQKGNIEVNFKNGGDSFMITLKDDGVGIDPNRIKKIAQEKGLKSKTDLEKMNDSDLLDMIFLAGFSTKDEVTDISGRGIGMDAVRESIDILGGEISISSKIDEGTTFFIKLPKVS
ncbi:response regulator, partial [Bacteriovoracales bacterium]|nr:response regulator [Bacteriovoracales bacterium]